MTMTTTQTQATRSGTAQTCAANQRAAEFRHVARRPKPQPEPPPEDECPWDSTLRVTL
jgi:hypothetical protein